MQNDTAVALVLAAGRGRRLASITAPFTKPLLPLNGVPVIAYSVQAAIAHVEEIIIVAHASNRGAIAGAMHHYLDPAYRFKPLRIVEQARPLGVADAIRTGLKKLAGDRKIVLLCGDNIFGAHNVANLLDCLDTHEAIQLAWTYKKFDPKRARRFAVWSPNDLGTGLLVEKPQDPPSEICWCGPLAFRSSRDVGRRLDKLEPSSRNEYEITDLLNVYLRLGAHQKLPLQGPWFDIGTPAAYREAQQELRGVNWRTLDE